MQQMQEPASTDFDQLSRVIGDGQLGAATKLAYWFLWDLRNKEYLKKGRWPDYICLTRAQLAGVFGRDDPRGAGKWLENLKAADLIDTAAGDRRGVLRIYIFAANPGTPAQKRPDPQQQLSFGNEEDFSAQKGPKPPSTDVSAQKSPYKSAHKGPNRKSPQNKAVTSIQGSDSDLSAHKSPRPLNESNEVQERNILPSSQGSNESNGSNEFNEGTAGGAHVSTAIAEALDQFLQATTLGEQKRKLQAEFIRAAGVDPATGKRLHRAIAGKAADHVVFHNVPLAEYQRVLADLGAMREAGSLDSGPRLFNAKVHQIDQRHGIGLFDKRARNEVSDG